MLISSLELSIQNETVRYIAPEGLGDVLLWGKRQVERENGGDPNGKR
jgi:hypothetical protein